MKDISPVYEDNTGPLTNIQLGSSPSDFIAEVDEEEEEEELSEPKLQQQQSFTDQFGKTTCESDEEVIVDPHEQDLAELQEAVKPVHTLEGVSGQIIIVDDEDEEDEESLRATPTAIGLEGATISSRESDEFESNLSSSASIDTFGAASSTTAASYITAKSELSSETRSIDTITSTTTSQYETAPESFTQSFDSDRGTPTLCEDSTEIENKTSTDLLQGVFDVDKESDKTESASIDSEEMEQRYDDAMKEELAAEMQTDLTQTTSLSQQKTSVKAVETISSADEPIKTSSSSEASNEPTLLAATYDLDSCSISRVVATYDVSPDSVEKSLPSAYDAKTKAILSSPDDDVFEGQTNTLTQDDVKDERQPSTTESLIDFSEDTDPLTPTATADQDSSLALDLEPISPQEVPCAQEPLPCESAEPEADQQIFEDSNGPTEVEFQPEYDQQNFQFAAAQEPQEVPEMEQAAVCSSSDSSDDEKVPESQMGIIDEDLKEMYGSVQRRKTLEEEIIAGQIASGIQEVPDDYTKTERVQYLKDTDLETASQKTDAELERITSISDTEEVIEGPERPLSPIPQLLEHLSSEDEMVEDPEILEGVKKVEQRVISVMTKEEEEYEKAAAIGGSILIETSAIAESSDEEMLFPEELEQEKPKESPSHVPSIRVTRHVYEETEEGDYPLHFAKAAEENSEPFSIEEVEILEDDPRESDDEVQIVPQTEELMETDEEDDEQAMEVERDAEPFLGHRYELQEDPPPKPPEALAKSSSEDDSPQETDPFLVEGRGRDQSRSLGSSHLNDSDEILQDIELSECNVTPPASTRFLETIMENSETESDRSQTPDSKSPISSKPTSTEVLTTICEIASPDCDVQLETSSVDSFATVLAAHYDEEDRLAEIASMTSSYTSDIYTQEQSPQPKDSTAAPTIEPSESSSSKTTSSERIEAGTSSSGSIEISSSRPSTDDVSISSSLAEFERLEKEISDKGSIDSAPSDSPRLTGSVSSSLAEFERLENEMKQSDSIELERVAFTPEEAVPKSATGSSFSSLVEFERLEKEVEATSSSNELLCEKQSTASSSSSLAEFERLEKQMALDYELQSEARKVVSLLEKGTLTSHESSPALSVTKDSESGSVSEEEKSKSHQSLQISTSTTEVSEVSEAVLVTRQVQEMVRVAEVVTTAVDTEVTSGQIQTTVAELDSSSEVSDSLQDSVMHFSIDSTQDASSMHSSAGIEQLAKSTESETPFKSSVEKDQPKAEMIISTDSIDDSVQPKSMETSMKDSLNEKMTELDVMKDSLYDEKDHKIDIMKDSLNEENVKLEDSLNENVMVDSLTSKEMKVYEGAAAPLEKSVDSLEGDNKQEEAAVSLPTVVEVYQKTGQIPSSIINSPGRISSLTTTVQEDTFLEPTGSQMNESADSIELSPSTYALQTSADSLGEVSPLELPGGDSEDDRAMIDSTDSLDTEHRVPQLEEDDDNPVVCKDEYVLQYEEQTAMIQSSDSLEDQKVPRSPPERTSEDESGPPTKRLALGESVESGAWSQESSVTLMQSSGADSILTDVSMTASSDTEPCSRDHEGNYELTSGSTALSSRRITSATQFSDTSSSGSSHSSRSLTYYEPGVGKIAVTLNESSQYARTTAYNIQQISGRASPQPPSSPTSAASDTHSSHSDTCYCGPSAGQEWEGSLRAFV